ncbi:HNH/endonuclease VII fold putative polymorphic toxin [Bacillus wiedmannii]|uniref:T7SS effector LXG polymorphic toxin n=2 Tax=Bacillus wiedmannii TaxID=1890302 RepID=UPI0024ADC583|nr:T7SS effector LXG polymorphic toxin [Bacillus wiedmannii]MDI6504880.1 HNH/endonuclease VII fold putative polymorphic toxin [Bacillus wiedmannii]MDI6510781.1 HNH/endonuclease VII fold putative polymorphic toxin [Bacillus wiedmannii]
MSLNMYLGEVQSQTNTMYAFCTATIQSMEQVIQSIDSFVGDSVLQGQTYDSAKMYFAETFLPLAQGIIYLCEELLRQNEAFPAEFQSRVASTDVVEQELLEQIREIDRMIASIEVTKQVMPLPDMDAMVNLFIEMRRKIQEKLEHLYEFNQTSSNNYATAIQLAASIAAGLAEVQSGKGFSPASGTFSTQRINMEWADSIHEYLDNDIRLDNSINTNNLIKSGIILGSSSEKNILEKFIKGVWNGSGKFIGGLVETYDSLDDTVTKENLKYAAGHPIETAFTMINTFSDTFMNEFWHGDAESRTQWGTNIFMEFGLGWIGDKGVGTIGKVTSLGDSVNLARFSESIPPISSQLPLKDRFAFAGISPLKGETFTPKDFLIKASNGEIKGLNNKTNKNFNLNKNIEIVENRTIAFNKAKDLAGVPRSQQPTRQWQVGDVISKKGYESKNYEYSANHTHHGRYYEYDTPQGKRVIVEHINDGVLHTHAGKPKDGANPYTYDFKKERYSNIYGSNNDHHIYYNK